MSDSIDYDELDKAVAEAIRTRNNSKSSTPKSAAPAHASQNVVVKNTTTTHATRPTSAHQYMDIIGKPGIHHSAQKIAKPETTEAQKPRRVAHITSTNSVMPKYRTASRLHKTSNAQISSIRPAAKPAAKPIEKPAPKIAEAPKVVAKPAPKPAAKPVEKPAPKPEKSMPPRGAATADPANLPGASKSVVRARRADAAENYSLSGSSSPFVEGAHVEKRPLGKNVPENARDLHSTKNQYSTRNPLKTRQNNRHVVTEDPKKTSGWLWTLLVILIVGAGAGLGYLAYLLVFAN